MYLHSLFPFLSDRRRETLEDLSCFSSPRSPRTNRSNMNTFTPSMPSVAGYGSSFYEVQDSMSRPKTAPVPPSLESPKANPRITSAKPPPLPRGQSKILSFPPLALIVRTPSTLVIFSVRPKQGKKTFRAVL